MQLASLLDRRAAADAAARAVSDTRETLTNAALLARVLGAAARLAAAGVGTGDVVAVRLGNRVELIVLLFAAWRLGAAVTPVNPALTGPEVRRQLLDSEAHVMVEDRTQVEAVDTEGVTVVCVDDLAAPDPDRVPVAPHLDPAATALLIYTSGTTGAPKGVVLDHANVDTMAAMLIEAISIGPADHCLLILPLFHVNGLVLSVVSPLLAGGSVHVADRFDAATFFAVVAQQRPTYVSAVPTILSLLAALPDHVRPDTSSLRLAICGAAPASSTLLERFERRFGVAVLEGYGLSEATCASTVNPMAGPRKPGTVGLALPGQEVRVRAADGGFAAPGTDGEIVVRGPNVMRGYLGRPEDTARTVVDGWLRTGDLGVLDADGYLTVVGRSKDLIIRGGENISPKEVEDVLTADPTVLEAAVIGVSDPTWGEVVVGYVQPRPGTVPDVDALAARCAAALSRYKRPTQILVIDHIPTNAVGKIDKVALRARHVTPAQEAHP